MEGLRLVEVGQSFDAPAAADVSRAVREEVRKLLRQCSLPRRSRVGITAGSRGVNDAVEIYRASVETLIEEGHSPFLFPRRAHVFLMPGGAGSRGSTERCGTELPFGDRVGKGEAQGTYPSRSRGVARA